MNSGEGVRENNEQSGESSGNHTSDADTGFLAAANGTGGEVPSATVTTITTTTTAASSAQNVVVPTTAEQAGTAEGTSTLPVTTAQPGRNNPFLAPAVSSGLPNNIFFNWPPQLANNDTSVINTFNSPITSTGAGITPAHLLAVLEQMSDVQLKAWPHISQVLQHSKEVMKLSVEHQRLELRRLELEGDRRCRAANANMAGAVGGGAASAGAGGTSGYRGPEICYRCNKAGHNQSMCPLKEYGLWLCFACKKVTGHQSQDCPQYDPADHERHQRRKNNQRKQEDRSRY